jgi:CRISPR/Cas system-associated exonuclease Cas4 (RecB family)
LKVGKDVGVGLVAVLGYHLAIDNYVELAVGPGVSLKLAICPSARLKASPAIQAARGAWPQS